MPQQNFGNFSISNSSNVIMGHVIKINGNIIINKDGNESECTHDTSENLDEDKSDIKQERKPATPKKPPG